MRTLILYGDLEKAVRRESAVAVAHWWGVSVQTVWAWRKALDVPPLTDGPRRLLRAYAPQPPRPPVAARPPRPPPRLGRGAASPEGGEESLGQGPGPRAPREDRRHQEGQAPPAPRRRGRPPGRAGQAAQRGDAPQDEPGAPP